MRVECSKKCQNTCPLNNKSVNNEEETQEQCIWWINSPDHNYCFWDYVKNKSSIDGSMLELSQSEIAQLMGWSNTKTHFMLKDAMVELVDALNQNKAKELLSQDPEQIVDVTTYDLEIISDSSNEDPTE